MFAFITLGSSSRGCGYICKSDACRNPLLIDAGVNVTLFKEALDYKLASVAGCLVSHAHGDHSKCVFNLMRNGVNCYASRDAWLELGGPTSHRAYVLTPHVQQKIQEWTVTPFDTVHDSPGALGFIIDDNAGRRLLYLTDSAYTTYLFDCEITHIAIECNHSREQLRAMVTEGRAPKERFARTLNNHMGIERVEEFLKANDLSKVKSIFLLHLSAENSNAEDFRRRVQEQTGIPTYIAGEKA